MPTNNNHSPSGQPVQFPKKGRYRHFKGGEYLLLDFVRHSENEQWLALYQPLYDDSGLWVRPLSMFCDQVERDGKLQPRFQWIADK